MEALLTSSQLSAPAYHFREGDIEDGLKEGG